MEATLDQLGRIEFPKELRDDLGLSAGTVLTIEERSGGILLKPSAAEQVWSARKGSSCSPEKPKRTLPWRCRVTETSGHARWPALDEGLFRYLRSGCRPL
jgi:AbrB family looped-hinge helix DNA binding protein